MNQYHYIIGIQEQEGFVEDEVVWENADEEENEPA